LRYHFFIYWNDFFKIIITQFLADSALKHIHKTPRTKVKLEKREIKWVITVPAIWNNTAKQIMRTAAANAGIADSIYLFFPIIILIFSDLILALEPEAAALYLQHKLKIIKEGKKYMIIDCGGGTVDMVFHEVDENSMVFCLLKSILIVINPDRTVELRSPHGGPWGSANLNQKFGHYLVQVSFLIFSIFHDSCNL
jgi:hypothetical protein